MSPISRANRTMRLNFTVPAFVLESKSGATSHVLSARQNVALSARRKFLRPAFALSGQAPAVKGVADDLVMMWVCPFPRIPFHFSPKVGDLLRICRSIYDRPTNSNKKARKNFPTGKPSK